MDWFNFKFSKPWYRQSLVLEELSMSNACLKRYMSEQQQKGLKLADMGYLKFEGFKEACWNPQKLATWLIENKLEPEPHYDYELAEQKRVRMGIVNLNNHKKKVSN